MVTLESPGSPSSEEISNPTVQLCKPTLLSFQYFRLSSSLRTSFSTCPGSTFISINRDLEIRDAYALATNRLSLWNLPCSCHTPPLPLALMSDSSMFKSWLPGHGGRKPRYHAHWCHKHAKVFGLAGVLVLSRNDCLEWERPLQLLQISQRFSCLPPCYFSLTGGPTPSSYYCMLKTGLQTKTPAGCVSRPASFIPHPITVTTSPNAQLSLSCWFLGVRMTALFR